VRRFTIGSAIVLALLLMLAAIATAAPENCEELPIDNPHYCGPPPSSTTTSTTTTTTTLPSTLEPCPTDTFAIPIPKPGPVNYECLWTPEDPMAAPGVGVEGIVKVAPPEGIDQLVGISSLVVFVRDDSPGDICLLTQGAENQTGLDGSFVGSFDLSYGDPPAFHEDWVNPYPLIFDKYVDKTYWNFSHFDDPGENGTHWCYPQDGIESMRQDLNGPPLHLWVRFRANPKAISAVWVTLTAAQEAGS